MTQTIWHDKDQMVASNARFEHTQACMMVSNTLHVFPEITKSAAALVGGLACPDVARHRVFQLR